jgi:hypothetical protein
MLTGVLTAETALFLLIAGLLGVVSVAIFRLTAPTCERREPRPDLAAGMGVARPGWVTATALNLPGHTPGVESPAPCGPSYTKLARCVTAWDREV